MRLLLILTTMLFSSAGFADPLTDLIDDVFAKPRGGEDFPFFCISDREELKFVSLEGSWRSKTGYVVKVAPLFNDEIAIPVTVRHREKERVLELSGLAKQGFVYQHFHGRISLGGAEPSRASLVPSFTPKRPKEAAPSVEMNCVREQAAVN